MKNRIKEFKRKNSVPRIYQGETEKSGTKKLTRSKGVRSKYSPPWFHRSNHTYSDTLAWSLIIYCTIIYMFGNVCLISLIPKWQVSFFECLPKCFKEGNTLSTTVHVPHTKNRRCLDYYTTHRLRVSRNASPNCDSCCACHWHHNHKTCLSGHENFIGIVS